MIHPPPGKGVRNGLLIADYVGHEDEHMIDTVYGHIMETVKTTFLDTLDAHYASLFS